jgi:hypothetical protein
MSRRLMERWHGKSWTALLTHEPYGLHFSVGAVGRPPTDAEVAEAADAYQGGIVPSAEITDWWQRNGQVNPWVRHYASAPYAERLRGQDPRDAP